MVTTPNIAENYNSCMIPFNDLKAAFGKYEAELKNVANKIIESGYFVLGPNVKAFEKEFASYIGAEHCFGVGNGTDAIEIGLRAIGVTEKSEVITVANAGGYTTSACLSIGATPVYVDIDDNLIISAEAVKNAITTETSAIVVTHLYGQAVDVDVIRQIAGDVPILEDCAEAHGAKINNKMVGSLGDISTFSYYPTKNLGALGDGGAVLCNDTKIAEQVTLLRQYGWSVKYHNAIPYGRNSRLDEIQAAFLRVMLTHIDELNDERKNILKAYCTAAPKLFEHIFSDERNVAHLAIATVQDREGFRQYATECGVATDIHFPVLDSDQESLANINFKKDELTNSRKFVEKIVSVPCYPGMSSDQIDTVCSLLSDWESKTA